MKRLKTVRFIRVHTESSAMIIIKYPMFAGVKHLEQCVVGCVISDIILYPDASPQQLEDEAVYMNTLENSHSTDNGDTGKPGRE